MGMSRGYCGIGVFGCKAAVNMGTLWRSACAFGASYLFAIAPRSRSLSRRVPTDTCHATRHLPYFVYASVEQLCAVKPSGVPVIAIELTPTATSLLTFVHPVRAIYLLGAEDTGIPADVLAQCQAVVQIPTAVCLNVATAGSLVLYDRLAKATTRPV
jgi:tRNA G18 (ribose-2'-O)-methylase SpoU